MQYPEWQKAIREAQAAETLRRDAEEKKRKEAEFIKQMKEEERLGRGFKIAMAMCRLPEPEDGTRLEVDGFVFTLRWFSEWSTKRAPRAGGMLPDEELAPDRMKFKIVITKPLPDDISPADVDEWRNMPWYDVELREWPEGEIEFSEIAIDHELNQATLSKIADKLDRLDKATPLVITAIRDWKAIKAKSKTVDEETKNIVPSPAPPPPPSTEQQLIDLIRRVIRDEVQNAVMI